MKLITLFLDNYQGINHLEIDAQGKNVAIYGENGTGKTTIANAIAWLLFGKSATGEKAYNPKPIDHDGTEKHFVETSVSGTFELEDGTTIQLRKVFSENWTRVRGQQEQTFKGHNTEHFIDDVPTKEKDYTARLATICDPAITQMLTVPDFFADQLPWQDRRSILLDICGDISDHDVIAAEPELQDLAMCLEKPGTSGQVYSIDEYVAIATGKKKRLNEQLRDLPTRIDEALRTMPAGLKDKDGLQDERTQEQAVLEELQRQLSQVASPQEAEIRAKIADLRAREAEAEMEYLGNQREATKEDQAAAVNLERRMTELRWETQKNEDDSRRIAQQIKKMEAERERLLEEYAKIKSETWDGDTTCPLCGQELSAEAIDKAREEFNKTKSLALTDINLRGAEVSADKIKELDYNMHEREKDARKASEEYAALSAELEDLKKRIHEKCGKPFKETLEASHIRAQIDELNTALTDSKDYTEHQRNALRSEISASQERIKSIDIALADIALAERQKQRIDELKRLEKQTAQDYEQAEYELHLCELFSRTKASMLDARINAKFKSVRFKLFKTQINGGQVDDCTVMVNTSEGLKPYPKANTGARMRASIEIMDTLGKHYQVHMPLLLDNFEAITNTIAPTDAQQIRLIAKEGVNPLQVEIL